jgi:phosphoglycerate kinase
MTTLPSLKDINVTGKTVLVRVDINVPMHGGKVTDNSRIRRIVPTVNALLKKKARVVLLSHFGRPEGKFVPSMSLAALVDEVASLVGREIKFGVDCIGPAAHEAVSKLKSGEVLMLENLRFHAEEEKGNPNFARELASLGDVFVNDAFSASHRAHASITGIAAHLPSVAGLLLQEEVEELGAIFTHDVGPVAAIIGGAKVSTKIKLLNHLVKTMDTLIIGGAMANTFLYAQGHDIGKSRCEKDMKRTALAILKAADKHGCKLVLPVDLVVTEEFMPQAKCEIVDVAKIPPGSTAADIGPMSVFAFAEALAGCKMVVWNGPVGAFETSPFDASNTTLARLVAKLTAAKKIRAIAGGGDTVASLAQAGLIDNFSYVSTAGGAFLEWLEGTPLPGVKVLAQKHMKKAMNT